jgi:DNA polymerase-3 subunit alpha
MWEMIKQIYSIFQFDTPVAVNALNKVNPRSVMDLSATNSLLRLMAREGRESPLELYARYHNDINEWYKDMDDYGLTKEEQEILKEHLSGSYGLADSQEKVMLLSMDERVSGFTLKEANTLRKSIAKKRADVLEETKIKFYNGCRNQGCSDKLANYVWEEQFGMSFGYVTMVMVCEPY